MTFIYSLMTFFIATSLHAAQTYPLDCRAGDFDNVGFTTKADGTNRLHVRFKPGQKPSTQGLAPGQCAWKDRGIRAGEPLNICLFNIKDITLLTSTTGTSTCTPKPQQNLFIHWTISAPWLEKVRDQSFYFTVNVASNGSDCLVVNP